MRQALKIEVRRPHGEVGRFWRQESLKIRWICSKPSGDAGQALVLFGDRLGGMLQGERLGGPLRQAIVSLALRADIVLA
jgi:hypothetical protein